MLTNNQKLICLAFTVLTSSWVSAATCARTVAGQPAPVSTNRITNLQSLAISSSRAVEKINTMMISGLSNSAAVNLKAAAAALVKLDADLSLNIDSQIQKIRTLQRAVNTISTHSDSGMNDMVFYGIKRVLLEILEDRALALDQIQDGQSPKVCLEAHFQKAAQLLNFSTMGSDGMISIYANALRLRLGDHFDQARHIMR